MLIDQAGIQKAPWTPEQVHALNAFQTRGGMHPFTCGDDRHGVVKILVATEQGWRCPDEECNYRQDWAPFFMIELGHRLPATETGQHGQLVTTHARALEAAADIAEEVALKLHDQGEIERETGALAVMAELRRRASEAPIVAYRSQGGRILRCLSHVPPEPDPDFYPVTADDLPYGGICTHPDCGVDVLIPQVPGRG
jgi:hypothetical protein